MKNMKKGLSQLRINNLLEFRLRVNLVSSRKIVSKIINLQNHLTQIQLRKKNKLRWNIIIFHLKNND